MPPSTRDQGLILPTSQKAAIISAAYVPKLFAQAGEEAAYSFLKFFTANIRNKNPRLAYASAVNRFARWCERRKMSLHQIEPVAVSIYIEGLQRTHAAPTVKQHLAAIRMLFDWLVREDQILR